MALEIIMKYVRSDDYLSIVATDMTGLYDATSNPGGYGGPNPAVGDFTSFTITVTTPDASTLLPSGTPVVIDAYPDLPSSSDGTFTLTSLDLIGSADTVLIDGVYLFEVEALEFPRTHTATNYKAFYEIVDCCIENMVVEAAGCGCSGDSEKIQNLVKAELWLSSLRPKVVNDVIVESAIERCGQWDKAATMILELQDICDNENCQGCNGCN